ncbi:putative leader peptide [Streptomyces longwoodensis]
MHRGGGALRVPRARVVPLSAPPALYAVSGRSTAARCRSVDTWPSACLHPAMSFPTSLTRRRAVDLVRVAAALCRVNG